MRSFEYGVPLLTTVPGSVTRTLARVDEGKGSERLFAAQLPGVLEQLALRARVQSITASSALEGIVVADAQRAERIIAGATTRLRTRSEQELAGYRDALDYIWQADWRPVNVGLVLHLHRLLHGRTESPETAGAFKASDNLVVDRLDDGRKQIRFRPVPATKTPAYTQELVSRFVAEREADTQHPVLLVGLFVLDLLVIHPFEDGNGRVARVLTTALLSDAGYGVGRYVSLEQLIADNADAYYASLLASTHGWHEAQHDPWPWLEYLVDRVADAYSSFAQRAASTRGSGSKQDRVREFVLHQAPEHFRIADIRNALPGISDGTIRLALESLRSEDRIAVDGTGRAATWTRW